VPLQAVWAFRPARPHNRHGLVLASFAERARPSATARHCVGRDHRRHLIIKPSVEIRFGGRLKVFDLPPISVPIPRDGPVDLEASR
jgi:hypothetical protein